MNNCACCTDRLLRHVRGTGVYWFCPHCRQEMPVIEQYMVSKWNMNKNGSIIKHASKTV